MANTYNNVKGLIANIYLAYPKVLEAAPKYGCGENCGLEDKEYSTIIVVNKDTAKALKGAHPKVKAVVNMKAMDADEMMDKYKFVPPYEAENYYVLTMKAPAGYKGGKPAKAPFVTGVAGCPDRITKETKIGNGTKAHIQFAIREWEFNGKKGESLVLQAVGIVDLVEYKSANTFKLAFETNESVFNVEEDEKKEETPIQRAKAKAKTVEAVVEEDGFDDEIPF